MSASSPRKGAEYEGIKVAKRVYFAFHYQDVIDFRANVVRNHNFLGVESAGYYDHSIWEEAQRTSPLALKRLINSELQNTSVTAVLIGTSTWARRWVRYEIMKSIGRGNRVIGIHINSIKGKDGMTKVSGPNPFDNLGVEIDASGTLATPTEWSSDKWIYNSDLAPFKISQQPEASRARHLSLSYWLRAYDWIVDNGYANFRSWIS
jgi:hypothetical protein